MAKIGIIEDDKLLNEALAIALHKEGYDTKQAFSFREGQTLCKERMDLFLVDINLPDGDGISLCDYIHRQEDVPVIFLTARDEEADMLGAFDAGADDYVVKPFQMKVLLKRIEAVLRRSSEEKEVFSYRNLRICFSGRQVSCNGKEITLTPKEYRLLEYMVKNKGQILTKENILEHVWDIDGLFVGDNTVSVTINRLRRKIEPDTENPVFIKNIFGTGYKFGE